VLIISVQLRCLIDLAGSRMLIITTLYLRCISDIGNVFDFVALGVVLCFIVFSLVRLEWFRIPCYVNLVSSPYFSCFSIFL
jgi:hypothetical protein